MWEFQVFLKIDFHRAKNKNKYLFESTYAYSTRWPEIAGIISVKTGKQA